MSRFVTLALATTLTIAGLAAISAGADSNALKLTLRSRDKADDGSYKPSTKEQSWDPKKTAVIVCDMWDLHHCRNATLRVGEIAPRMNDVVKALRERGVTVIHAPSSCMDYYEGHPSRDRAKSTPRAAKLPDKINQWCSSIPAEEMDKYPIDQSDGGEDDDPAIHKAWARHLGKSGRNAGRPWKRQIDTIEIDGKRDYISDSGVEIWSILTDRGIDNVILVGVHTNMCVLGRPFGLRQMATNGKNVVLMRDMTDTMYNPASRPFVSHYRGTELIIEHIEKYVCPTVTSDQVIGGEPFKFKWDKPTKVVVAIAEPEYQTEKTLPKFVKEQWTPERGYDVTIVHGDPSKHDIPGLVEALEGADVLVLSVRRQALPKEQIDAIRAHLAAGKALMGIRTSSHSFDARGKGPAGHVEWPEFDAEVLAGNYRGHHGKSPQTTVTAAADAARHPILAGIELPFKVDASLYINAPLREGATALLIGEIEGKPAEPVAWTHQPGGDEGPRVFYTSLGDVSSFERTAFIRLMNNALKWAHPLPSDVGPAVPPSLQKIGPANSWKEDATEKAWAPGALSPAEEITQLKTPEDLAIDLVASEPSIEQPLHVSFDERGRMWVVQYRQYPEPAGLKEMSRDNVWRVVYDRKLPPPPYAADSPFLGRDRITIHEDSDGDGTFEHVKVFADGLNITTSVARGRGGVWVLSPPQLLFYPDADGDDVPDGDPVVHLDGFNLEDTHSVANSLTWGPDGWLYGAQGSTVSGDIVVPGKTVEPIHTQGQLIWRYHPERREFEVFAEGGGNAFGCDFDSKGRVFSGHNGGDTRGFHYVQGGYLRKGFNKHGPLSNPYAFGYFNSIPHHQVKRFSHQFVIYEADALPDAYRGKLIGVDPLNHYLPVATIEPDGASFKTKDVASAIETEHNWFRPVHVTVGPYGDLYVCDWYDAQVNHYRNHEGQIDHGRGRIYRLRDAKSNAGYEPFNLAAMTTAELIATLDDTNPWRRATARRVLADRRDAEAISPLRERLAKQSGQPALEALWALNVVGGLDEAMTLTALNHDDPYVRLWAVRLVGDDKTASEPIAQRLAEMARSDANVEVRSQLAATAKRLPVDLAWPIIAGLSGRGEDAKDRYVPLQVWWALESACTKSPDAVVDAIGKGSGWWAAPLTRQLLAQNTVRRFASAGTRADLLRCARLIDAAPDDATRKTLIDGFELAFQGRPLGALPKPLVDAIRKAGGGSRSLRVLMGDEQAIAQALQVVGDESAKPEERVRSASLFAVQRRAEAIDVLIGAVKDEHEDVAKTAAAALAAYDDERIAAGLIASYGSLAPAVQSAVSSTLVSRPAWAKQAVAAAESGKIDPATFGADDVERLKAHGGEIADAAAKTFASRQPATPEHLKKEIERVTAVLEGGVGSPYNGKKLFLTRCAACHQLFNDGGAIGPSLTAYQRDDLQTMLLSIVNPNAEIREGYENVMITTVDGRVVTGFLADHDASAVVLRGVDGQTVTLPRDQIAEERAVGRSLMPEGLLAGLSDEELRNLFAYLRSTQPLVRLAPDVTDHPLTLRADASNTPALASDTAPRCN